MAKRKDTQPRMEVDTVTLRNQTTETMKLLRTLDDKIQKRVLGKGARAGGAVMLKGLRKNAPKTNRFLSRSLAQKVKRYPNGNVVAVMGQNRTKMREGIKGTKAQQRNGLVRGGLSGAGKVVPDHLVALPTRSHPVRPRNVTAMKIQGRFGTIFSAGHNAASTAGNYFHEKTFLEYRNRADNAASEKISAEVDAELKKLPKVK